MNVPNYKIEKINNNGASGYLPYNFAAVSFLDTLANEAEFSFAISAPENAKKMRLKNIILVPTVRVSTTDNVILPQYYDCYLAIATRNGALLLGNQKSAVVDVVGCNVYDENRLYCTKGNNLFLDTEIYLNNQPMTEAIRIYCSFSINTAAAVPYRVEYRIQIIGDYSIT